MTGPSRGKSFVALLAIVGLGAISVWLQMERDRRYGTDKPAEQILYVQSPAVMKRLVLSYDAIAADVYWIRALQYFGGAIRAEGRPRYDLLYPLLDLSTSLDPRFNLAYRFGSLFLTEKPPHGPNRPDQAIALLEKGLKAMPEKWEYHQDIGFVYYWSVHDYEKASDHFLRGSQIAGAPWFLKPLAAVTLAQGGNRNASRTLYRALAEQNDDEWMRKDATRRLKQLDTLDELDQLRPRVQMYLYNGGTRPMLWMHLITAGVIRQTPHDTAGKEYFLDPWTGRVEVDKKSPLFPMPEEPPASARKPRPLA